MPTFNFHIYPTFYVSGTIEAENREQALEFVRNLSPQRLRKLVASESLEIDGAVLKIGCTLAPITNGSIRLSVDGRSPIQERRYLDRIQGVLQFRDWKVTDFLTGKAFDRFAERNPHLVTEEDFLREAKKRSKRQSGPSEP